MKLASWNVNGIRAAERNGFLKWLADESPDIVGIQETKANEDQLGFLLTHPAGYQTHWFSAQKAGYSGVALFLKKEPLSVREGMGIEEFDSEGRVITAEYPSFFLVNAYFPNSQREGARLAYKLAFCQAMENYLKSLQAKSKEVILCGDYNIAHQPIDLKNPKENEKNAGYLPEERAWMTRHLSQGFVDPFRKMHSDPGHYTWWSYRPTLRERNIGWRIDYHTVSEGIADRVASTNHQPHVLGSDHCPVLLTLRD